MSTIKSLSGLGAVLASLAVVAVSFASSALASTSMIPVGGSGGPDGTTAPATVVHTVVVGRTRAGRSPRSRSWPR